MSEYKIDSWLLPDKLQPVDMQAYGYKWDGILPLTSERAAELFENNVTVYKLYPDNTETVVEDKIFDIEQHGGMFGIEKRDWLIYLRDKIELMSKSEREGLIDGVEAGFDNGYDVAAEDIAIYHCLTDNVKLPEKLTEHSTGIVPVDKRGTWYELPFRVIEKAHYNGQDLFLIESEAPESLDSNVIVDENCNVIIENAGNGFKDYLVQRDFLYDRFDLRHPISFKSDSGADIELKQYFKMPHNLNFVFNDVYKIYIGKVGNLEDRIILKTSDNDYIYSVEFNKDYGEGKIHLTSNLDLDKYNFEILGNSEYIQKNYSTKDIEQLISKRKQTPYGVYVDIGESLKNVSTLKLAEYFMDKSGETRLRDFLETEIIAAEILKSMRKNSSKTNTKTHEDYER